MRGPESIMRALWTRRLPDSVPRWINVRLGQWHDKNEARIASVMMKYSDLIFFRDGIINIVEFKVKKQAEAIGQLLTYRQEFRKTIEFMPYWDYSIMLKLVAEYLDRAVEEAAIKQGITYEVFNVEKR